MDYVTFDILDNLKKIYGGTYGKIAQKLLALTFEKLNFEVEPHEIEGLDIRAIRGEEKYALEVKTTEQKEGSFMLGEKDIKWIPEMTRQGYKTGYALLVHLSTEDWIIGSSDGMKKGGNSIAQLRKQSFSALENEINQVFGIIVKNIGKKLLEEKPSSPLQWLNKYKGSMKSD